MAGEISSQSLPQHSNSASRMERLKSVNPRCFAEQVAVDVLKLGEVFVKVRLPFIERVFRMSNRREMQSQVRTIRRSVVLDVELERFAREQSGVFRKQAKQDADEKAFKVVSGVTARFQRIVQFAEGFQRPRC